MKILLVEDDHLIAEPLQHLLRDNGYDVVHARTLKDARNKIDQIDFMILDRGLPDGDGLALLSELRIARNTLPVIILTAMSDVSNRVLGLDLGADDYVTKPFEPQELMARIRLRLKKSSLPESGDDTRDREILTWGPFVVDCKAHTVRFHGEEVSVTPKEFLIIKLFVQEPERLLSRETLLTKIWGLRFHSTRTVDVHIASLRQKFGVNTFETIHGVGYRLGRGLKDLAT